VRHFTSPDFWKLLNRLPPDIQRAARESFEILKDNPRHPSLHLKKIGDSWSARVGRGYRVLGRDVEGGILWGWIGTHADYDRLLG
jgi:mRNA-degrading endonuclease RelE of RelBE toxin-antitoxin system